MKSIVSIILALSILSETARCETTNDPPLTMLFSEQFPEYTQGSNDAAALICGVILAAFAGGLYIWWKVRGAFPTVGCKATLILNRSTDMVNWTPIATNTVVLTSNDWLTVFKTQTTDPNAYYRVVLAKNP